MWGNKEEKEIKSHTVVFMIAVAVFFDFLQILLGFIYMGWVVGIFAGLTFYVWFKFYNISFTKPKRILAFGGASLLEIIPVPFLASIPAWTAAVSYLALSKKLKKVIPGEGITKLDIMK